MEVGVRSHSGSSGGGAIQQICSKFLLFALLPKLLLIAFCNLVYNPLPENGLSKHGHGLD